MACFDYIWRQFKFEMQKNQRREYVVHTGQFHTGVINGNTYNIEITFNYSSATEFVRESKKLTQQQINNKKQIYSIGDKLVAGLENVREEYTSAGGVGYRFRSTISNNNITVLGKYPDYIILAKKLNARYFSIPNKIWESMSEDKKWLANQKFLDRTIKRNDQIILSKQVKSPELETGYFRKELEYLIDKGYEIDKKGNKLIKK